VRIFAGGDIDVHSFYPDVLRSFPIILDDWLLLFKYIAPSVSALHVGSCTPTYFLSRPPQAFPPVDATFHLMSSIGNSKEGNSTMNRSFLMFSLGTFSVIVGLELLCCYWSIAAGRMSIDPV